MNTLTSGQAARLLHVSPRKVAQWIDQGLLRGFRVFSGKHRRIEVSALADFCRGHNWPMPPGLCRLMTDREQVFLCIANNLLAAETARQLLPVKCRPINTPFRFGLHGNSCWIDVVIMDMGFLYGRVATQNLILEAYHALPWASSALWIFLGGDDEAAYDPPKLPKCATLRFIGDAATPEVLAAAAKKYLLERQRCLTNGS